MRIRPPTLTLVVALLAVSSCVELPLEHTNYFDPRSDRKLEIRDMPDTLNSIGETFSPTVRSTPRLPAVVDAVQWEIVEGTEVLEFVGGITLRARPTVGLIPVAARVRAWVGESPTGPSTTRQIVLRQRPAVAALTCASPEGCASVGGLSTVRDLAFELRDALDHVVNLPGGSFRYGEVISRAPAVVSVLSRATPARIQVRTESVGSAWLVLLGPGGIADSLLMTVVP